MKPPIIGITGKLGSGKDSVFERLDALYPGRFVRASFAAKLKESVAALLGTDVRLLEHWKRLENIELQLVDVNLHHEHDNYRLEHISMTIRTLLQRFGTEVGRNIFGEDFWVDQAMRDVDEWRQSARQRREAAKTLVFTDVRFKNEAKAIMVNNGEIWQIVGPDQDTGDHPSEAGIGPSLIEHTIDNRTRDDGFSLLDSKLKQIVDTWGYSS